MKLTYLVEFLTFLLFPDHWRIIIDDTNACECLRNGEW